MFYINYEECKFVPKGTLLQSISRFILTMRNVNAFQKMLKLAELKVLY